MPAVGSVHLTLLGRERRFVGGRFDDYAPPAIGVCLEACSVHAKAADLLVPVADFQPPGQQQLVAALARLLGLMRARPQAEIYVGCRAGIGRTGTFIAAAARLAGIADAVRWTRMHYHPHAVETLAQEACVAALDVHAVWREVAGGGNDG